MKNHLFDWLDKTEGLDEGTTSKNIKKELKRQGYTAKKYIDDNTQEPFIGWSKTKS